MISNMRWIFSFAGCSLVRPPIRGSGGDDGPGLSLNSGSGGVGGGDDDPGFWPNSGAGGGGLELVSWSLISDIGANVQCILQIKAVKVD